MHKVTPVAVKDAVRSQRAAAARLFDELAAIGQGSSGITRDTYGPGEQRAHEAVCDRARRRGLEVSHDAAANSYLTLPGADRHAPRVVIGSHLDSVPNGGNFDGAAGVVAGLISVEVLTHLDCRPVCDITVMAIRAEESVWFQTSYIGSRAALGRLPVEALAATRIDTGRTLAEHIDACGGSADALSGRPTVLGPHNVRAFLELHIEQASSLVEAEKAVAICTGIPGHFRYPDAVVVGRHDHVGTPRRHRHDAMMAAVDCARALDEIWAAHEATGHSMAVTFGRFHTDAARHGLTTVPGTFHFSLDVRAHDQALLDSVEAQLLEAISTIELARRVRFILGARAAAPIGEMNAPLRAQLQQCATELEVPSILLGSPASHDAAAFAAAGFAVGMLFVRNEHGSHNPREHMDLDDFLDGVSVLAWWLLTTVGG